MKLLGRLMLFAVGGVLLYLSISSIISNYQAIQVEGWDSFFNGDNWNAVLQILVQAFYALCGLYSIYLGLRGKSTFVSFVAAAILIAIVVYRTMQFVKTTDTKDFQAYLNLVLTYIMPIGFSLGVIFLTVQGKDKKN